MAAEVADGEALSHPSGMIDLNSLMLFYEIVNAKSINQAAARLDTSKATLSRRLRELEEQVGAVLLKRGPRGLELTDIGAALCSHCERIAAEARRASVVASEMQSQVRGTLRVSIAFGLANTKISEAIVRYALRYPDVKLILHVTNRWVDVSEEPYDVAISVGRIRNERLPVRRIAELGRGVYASPAYCERRGIPKQPQDLLKHSCIVLDRQLDDGLWNFPMGVGKTAMPSQGVHVTDIVIAKELAVGGVGYAVLTHVLAKPDVEAKRLVRVLPDWRIPPVVLAATFLERRHLPVRIRAFLDLVAEQFQASGG